MENGSRNRTEHLHQDLDGFDADVIIVGGGAAGLSAALTLARAGRRTVVIDAGRPRNRFASHMHGFLSRDGVPPGELIAAGRAEVESYGGVIRRGTVVAATVNDEGTRVEARLDDGSRLRGRRLLLTTGLRDELPPIEGIAERWGKDVLHCPYCHGYEVRNQPIGLIATGPFSLHAVHLFRQWSPDFTLFLNGLPEPEPAEIERLRARDIRIVEGAVSRLVIDEREDRLTGVELTDGTVIERRAVFVGSQLVVDDPLLQELGVTFEHNEYATWVKTDQFGLTSVPGVWAAGNVAEPWGQVLQAAGAGAFVAAAINNNLVEEDVDLAVAHAASLLPSQH